MITITFLTGWALRSVLLSLSGALVLWVCRAKDPAVRLAVMLLGSLAIPALNVALPKVRLTILPWPSK